ncbi:MAG: histidine--tRNA ligase [Chloroflexi bacterium]|nr:histidine--tRNA ligase [Chloroflexota bacterium]
MYTAPRGTHDILPEEWPYWRYIIDCIHETAALFGFEQIDTPIFEATSLYVRGVGEGTDIVDKEMYSFRDKGGEEITLRPEFTAGIMRAYLENGMRVRPQPVKLYSIGPVFRFERPQAGRYRQHHQFNVEVIGEQDPAVDAEVISVAWHLFKRLGFRGLSLQINSTGCPQCRPAYLKELVAYYRQHTDEICEDCKRRLERNPLRVLDCKNAQCQPVIAHAPKITDHLCEECATHFSDLRSFLDGLEMPYTLNHRLVRGLDYYTKTVFEIYAEGIGAQNAVCGGGRYDGLIEELGGPPTPGIGFGSGIERQILTMKEQGIEPPPLPKPVLFVAHVGPATRLEAFRLTSELREAGLSTLFGFGQRSLKAQMKSANRAGVRYALILGDDELAAGVVTVRDLRDSTQETVRRDRVIAWLQERLASSPATDAPQS